VYDECAVRVCVCVCVHAGMRKRGSNDDVITRRPMNNHVTKMAAAAKADDGANTVRIRVIVPDIKFQVGLWRRMLMVIGLVCSGTLRVLHNPLLAASTKRVKLSSCRMLVISISTRRDDECSV